MNQKGFTLIETFIAITVLLMAILGPMTLVSRSIADASYAANQITAFYLAQEGLELVINRREQNEDLPDNLWLQGLDDCDNKLCEIYLDDRSDIVTKVCAPEGCENFVLDNEGRYTYADLAADSKPTSFNRSIIIKPQPSLPVTGRGNVHSELTIDAIVDVWVDWNDKGKIRSFNLSTLLTN